MAINSRYDAVVLDLIESASRNIKALPVNLGGVSGAYGGVGGPPGGFIGRLPQTRVAYDESELGTDYTPASGMSLLDNLNHIRYRLDIIESGGSGSPLTVEEYGGTPSVPNVATIVFSGAVNVIDDGGNQVTVEITASGGGGISDAPSDGNVYGRKDASWINTDTRYLKLEATNDPLTGKLSVIPSVAGTDVMYLEGNGDTYVLDVEQYTTTPNITSELVFLYRETGGVGNITAPMIAGYQDAYGAGTITGDFIYLEDYASGAFFEVDKDGNVNIPSGTFYNVNGVPHVHSGYMLASNNLSDLADAGTARTNLGLVSGGAGDIWVEKAGGDTIQPTNTTTVNLTLRLYSGQTANLLSLLGAGGAGLGGITYKGYATFPRIYAGGTPGFTTALYSFYSSTETSTGQVFGSYGLLNVTPATNSLGQRIAGAFYATVTTGVDVVTGEVHGGWFFADIKGTTGCNVPVALGGYFVAAQTTANASTIGKLTGGKFWAGVGAATTTTAYGIEVLSPAITTGSLVTGAGIYINSFSGATNNYAIYTNLGDNSFGDDIVLRNDNDKLRIGALSTGDLYLTHDGANSIIYNDTGLLKIQDAGTGINLATANTEKVGLYGVTPVVQPTTAIAEASFTENAGGTAVNVDSTFDGYTLQQVVKALRDLGTLA